MLAVIGPLAALFTIDALFLPHANRTIRLAAIMVPQPMVMADVGIFSTGAKLSAASWRVIAFSWTARVSEFLSDPGSLKPIDPDRPMSRI